MSTACTSCRRPVPLSADEIAVLESASLSAAGVRLSDLPEAQADSVRMLVRMGYVVTAANDDGPADRVVLVTEHGLRWLDQDLRQF